MRQALRPHPDTPCEAVAHIEVAVARPGPGALALTYSVTGAIGDLYLPPAAAPARADGLWRRTCFEAFVRAAPGPGDLRGRFPGLSKPVITATRPL